MIVFQGSDRLISFFTSNELYKFYHDFSLSDYTPNHLKLRLKSNSNRIRNYFSRSSKIGRSILDRSDLKVLHWNNFIPSSFDQPNLADLHLFSPGLDRFNTILSKYKHITVGSSQLLPDSFTLRPLISSEFLHERRWDFAFVGTSSKNKNITTILRSFQNHLRIYPDSKLLLLIPLSFSSDQPPKWADKTGLNLISRIPSDNITPIILDKIVPYPGISSESVAFFLSNVANLILLSKTEGEPRIANEAASISCNVVINANQRSNISSYLSTLYPVSWIADDSINSLESYMNDYAKSKHSSLLSNRQSSLSFRQSLMSAKRKLEKQLSPFIPIHMRNDVMSRLLTSDAHHLLAGHYQYEFTEKISQSVKLVVGSPLFVSKSLI